MTPKIFAVGALALVSATGCKDDISRFSTADGESYCGDIVQGAFVRDGFGPGVHMRMTFDVNHMEDDQASPGLLTTVDQQSGEHLFIGAPLRVIAKLNSDPLSMLQFGEGRERNLIFAVDPSDPASGPTIFAVVSLLHSGDTEVRLIRGAAPLPDGGAPSPMDPKVLFGVFPLQRRLGTCGF